MTDDPTKSLILRTQGGDIEAYGEVILIHGEELLRFIGGLVWLPMEEREEIAQEAFLRAFEMLERFDPERPFFNWLAGIARKVACEHLAATRRLKAIKLTLAERAVRRAQLEQAEAMDDSQARNRIQALLDCVDHLPSRFKDLIRQHYAMGTRIQDIAKHMHKPLGTVKTWLFRARADLRDCVEHKSENA